MEDQLHADNQCGIHAHSRGNEPGREQQQDACGRQQAAAQVVDNLPAIERRERISSSAAIRQWHTGENPAGDLPVTANPAMGPLGIALVPLRKVIEQLDIAGQPHPDMGPFDQVVAQDPVFREPSRQ